VGRDSLDKMALFPNLGTRSFESGIWLKGILTGWVSRRMAGQGPKKGKIGNESFGKLNIEVNARYAEKSKSQPPRRRGGHFGSKQAEPRVGRTSRYGISCHQGSAEQFVSGTLRNLFGQPSMIYAASIQNFETGNLSGLQSRRLTDYNITEEGDICLVQNCG